MTSMTPKEITKFVNGNGAFLSAVYQSEAGFVVVSSRHPLNKIVRQQYVAEEIARVEAERITAKKPSLM